MNAIKIPNLVGFSEKIKFVYNFK